MNSCEVSISKVENHPHLSLLASDHVLTKKRLRVYVDGDIIDGTIRFADEHGEPLTDDSDPELWEAVDDLARSMQDNPDRLSRAKSCGDEGMLVEWISE